MFSGDQVSRLELREICTNITTVRDGEEKTFCPYFSIGICINPKPFCSNLLNNYSWKCLLFDSVFDWVQLRSRFNIIQIKSHPILACFPAIITTQLLTETTSYLLIFWLQNSIPLSKSSWLVNNQFGNYAGILRLENNATITTIRYHFSTDISFKTKNNGIAVLY